jgi:hypothetical protein
MTAPAISTYPCAQPAGLGQPGASWIAPLAGVVGGVCPSQAHGFGARMIDEAAFRFGERAGRGKNGTTGSAGAAGGGRT